MAGKSEIHWCDYTWNPVTGCSKVSPGCEHCYAETISLRFKRSAKPWTFPNAAENVVLHPERMEQPFHWRKPGRVFVNSMSDLFHEQVPDGLIWRVWEVMLKTPWHTYQILTKRPERMRDFVTRWSDLRGESPEPQLVRGPEETRARHPSGRGQLFAAWLDYLFEISGREVRGAWPTFDWMEGPRWWSTAPLSNVWLGVSVEDQRRADERIPVLLQTPAAVRFISAEPLLEPLNLLDEYLQPWFAADDPRYYQPGGRGLDWVITGAESGPRRRPFDEHWARDIRQQCEAMGTAFFFKQGSGPRPGMNRELDGQLWEQYPEDPEWVEMRRWFRRRLEERHPELITGEIR